MSDPARPASSSVVSALGALTEGGLLLLILAAPLPLGSVQPEALFLVMLWTAVLAWLAFAADPGPRSPRALGFWPWLVVGVLAVAAVQIAPLPAALVRLISPSAVRLREAIPLSPPLRWMTLSIHPEATAGALARLATFAAVFLISMSAASRRRGYRRILAAILGIGLFEAAYGAAEYLSGRQHIFGTAKRFYTDAATGTYVNQNHFAGLLEMALLVAIGFVLSGSWVSEPEPRDATWRRRVVAFVDGPASRAVLFAVAAALVGLGLVLSYSRSGLAAAACAAALVVLFEARRRRSARWLAGIAVLGGGLVLFIGLVGWGRVAADLSRQMQAISWDQSRFRVWRDCTRIVRDFPLFGSGLGTFPDLYPSYRHPNIQLLYDHAHNDWLQLLLESGIVGAAAALTLLGAFWFAVIRGLADYHRSDRPLLIGAAGGAFALMLHELTDFNLWIPANALVFAALCGAVLGGLFQAEDEQDLGARVLSFTPRRLRRVRSEARA